MKRFTILLIFITAFSFAFCAQSEKEIKVEIKGDASSGVGLIIKSLDKTSKEKLDLEAGALILSVIPETSADEAGLKSDDVVIEANGQKIENASQLNEIAESLELGDKLDLKVIRKGAKKSFSTEIKEMDHGAYAFRVDEEDGVRSFSIAEIGDMDHNVHVNVMPELKDHDFVWHVKEGSGKKGGYMGVELDNINDQMKAYFEVKQGALIKKVTEDSPAAEAGLKAGDIITKINDKEIEDVSDVVRTVNFYDPEDEVTVYFVRKGSSESTDVVLGKKEFKWSGNKANAFFISEDDDVDGEKIKKQIRIESKSDLDGNFLIKSNLDLQIYII